MQHEMLPSLPEDKSSTEDIYQRKENIIWNAQLLHLFSFFLE